jgi:hypothetical protein
MTALAALPSNMRFDDCDGCRVEFNKRAQPFVLTVEDEEGTLTVGVCPSCALTLGGADRAKAAELSAKVEATARLRTNRMEVAQ